MPDFNAQARELLVELDLYTKCLGMPPLPVSESFGRDAETVAAALKSAYEAGAERMQKRAVEACELEFEPFGHRVTAEHCQGHIRHLALVEEAGRR